MSVSIASNSSDRELESLADKTSCAADILKHTVSNAADLQKVHRKITRYIRQTNLILAWKRSSGICKMAGSAAKTVGNVMVLAAPLHPKLGLAVKVGHKLWKFGAGLKILNAVGNMLKDLWQTGCRNALVEFTHCTAQLTRNLGLFSEVIQDLQASAQIVNNNNISQTPQEIINILRLFLPAHQIGYATHVINIAFGSRYYSPLFDFIAMASDPTTDSNIVQLMREIEAFHFTDFVEKSDSKPLAVIGSLLHISRELLDFLDGLQRVTEQDCRFLQDCLTRFTQESLAIMKVVSVLTSLDQIRRQQLAESPTVSEASNGPVSLYDNRDGYNVNRAWPGRAIMCGPSSSQNQNDSHPAEDNDPVEAESAMIVDISSPGPHDQMVLQEARRGNGEMIGAAGPSVDINETTVSESAQTAVKESHSASSTMTARIIQQSQIVQNSKMFLLRTLSTVSVAVNKGTSLMTSAVQGVRGTRRVAGDQLVDGDEAGSSLNRI